MNDQMRQHVEAEQLRYSQTLEARLRLTMKFVPMGALYLEQERFEGWKQPKICFMAAPLGCYLDSKSAMQIRSMQR